MVDRFHTHALQVESHFMVEENIQLGDYIITQARETAERGSGLGVMLHELSDPTTCLLT
jgi:SOS-response transcriptional repressor LexA